MKRVSLVAGFLGILACSSSSKVAEPSNGGTGTESKAPLKASDASPTVTTQSPNSQGSKDASVTAIEMKYVGIHRIHPPLSDLLFDFVLHNNADRPRWFLLPRKLDVPPAPLGSSFNAMEAFALLGKGNVVLGEFLGVPGFQGVKLPAGGQIALRNVKVRLAGELPASPLHFEVVVCDQVSIRGEPIEAWFEGDPLSDATADVSRQNAKQISSRDTPDLKSVAAVLVGAERHTLSVEVTAPK